MLQGQKCSIYSVRVMDSFLFIQISVAASADRIFAFKVYNTIIAANELYNIVKCSCYHKYFAIFWMKGFHVHKLRRMIFKMYNTGH